MATTDRHWWHRPFRMFQTNIREIDAGLDVERVLDRIVAYGANTWLLSVGGIVSNYPTELAHQSPNPALSQRTSGDLIGDATAAAKARGVRVVARMDFSKIARPIAEQHPEWAFIGPDGEHQVFQGLTSVCPSGEYYQHRLLDVIGEVLDRYEIDGFFFNWMSFNEVDYAKRYRGVCQCVACQESFTAATGLGELPTGPQSEHYERWHQFAQATIDELLARVRAFIASKRPQAPLIMGDTADIVFHEANNALGRDLWHPHTQVNVSLAKSYRPNVPVLVNSVAFVDMPYRLVSEDPHHFEQYLLQAISRGAIPSTYIMGTPEEFDYPSLAAGTRITQFHRDHEHVYDGLEPAASTALLHPGTSKIGPTAAGSPQRLEEFRGWWHALSAHHIPVDALAVTRLSHVAADGGLDRYRLLILPDLGPLPDEAARALDAWVGEGGRLLLTGSSALSRGGSQLTSSGIEARVATLATPEATWSSVVLPDPDDRPSALPIIGAFHVLRAAPGSRTKGAVLSRAPYGPPEKCYGHLPLDHPPLLSNDHGVGEVVTLSWTPGRALRSVGLSAVSDYMAEAAANLLGDGDVDTDLPGQVEVILGRSGAGLVAHLLNASGLRHQGYSPAVPVQAGHRLAFPGRPDAQARSLRRGEDLGPAPDGGFLLPQIDAFDVIVVT